MTYPRLVFRLHAVQRMAERGVTIDDVRLVLNRGEVIAQYPDDTPLPSPAGLGVAGRSSGARHRREQRRR